MPSDVLRAAGQRHREDEVHAPGNGYQPSAAHGDRRGLHDRGALPRTTSEIWNLHYGDGLNDGQLCQRMRLLGHDQKPVFFGGVVGSKGHSVTRSATVRSKTDARERIPALWLLDPVRVRCALRVGRKPGDRRPHLADRRPRHHQARLRRRRVFEQPTHHFVDRSQHADQSGAQLGRSHGRDLVVRPAAGATACSDPSCDAARRRRRSHRSPTAGVDRAGDTGLRSTGATTASRRTPPITDSR